MNELINNVEVERLPIPETEIKKTKKQILSKNKITTDEKVVQKINKKSSLDGEMLLSLAPSPKKRFMPITSTNLTINPKKLPSKKIIVKKQFGQQKTMKENLIIKPTQGYPELGKLNTLISDAGIESVECFGPNKNILVKKGGRIQRTKIILTKEEIKQILRDFSQKTKIPLTKGTFKAALGNLILTAILSEFVGTKFILQKKNPVIFQNPL
tara:strand:- start:187 stop:822 length:636 start_codon:yes stop_codon:yes gene_type:complete